MRIGKTYERAGYAPFEAMFKFPNGDMAGIFHHAEGIDPAWKASGIVTSYEKKNWSPKKTTKKYYSCVCQGSTNHHPFQSGWYDDKGHFLLEDMRKNFKILREDEIEVEVDND